MKRKVTVRRKAEKKARKAAKKAAREAEKRKSAKGRVEKRDVKVKTVEDRLCWKLVGLALVAAAVFLALALATFDWESVRTLCENPRETTNLIGVYKTDEGLIRTQGALILNEEIDRIVQFAVKQWPAQFDASIAEGVASESEGGGAGEGGDAENGISEEEYNQARAVLVEA